MATESEGLQNVFIGNTIEVLRSFAHAVEARDEHTKWHSSRVADVSCKLARKLNLTDANVQLLFWAAALHDLGKIAIPEHILCKRTPLTVEELRIIGQHPSIGAGMLYPIGSFKNLIPIIYHHHERFDGKGYPDGLKGAAIPFLSRIITVADAFEAMTSDRSYRKALDQERVLDELRTKSAAQFDPVVIEAFMELVAAGELSANEQVLDYVI